MQVKWFRKHKGLYKLICFLCTFLFPLTYNRRCLFLVHFWKTAPKIQHAGLFIVQSEYIGQELQPIERIFPTCPFYRSCLGMASLFLGQQIPEWLRLGCASRCAFFSDTMTFEFLDHHLYDWRKVGDGEPVVLHHLLLPASIPIWAMPWVSVQLACCCCLRKRWASQQCHGNDIAMSNRWPMCSIQTCLKRLIEEETEQRGNWACRHENRINITFTKQHPITVPQLLMVNVSAAAYFLVHLHAFCSAFFFAP